LNIIIKNESRKGNKMQNNYYVREEKIREKTEIEKELNQLSKHEKI